ncbi:MAG: FAD-dependent oxidoreductase [SAR324 cluster bacterium]|nr:FAD-dependent oxidoreductase [SAR324 cluster bacterium]MCZ6843486.1 FAD-dependent oxidoreductase [SAR324 cluster bacterium]
MSEQAIGDKNFDAIVVGAGPAGSMAAWRLAGLGHNVALLERGEFPGAKNLFGGIIYSLELQKYFPDFVASAPIERPVTRHATYLLAQGRSLNFDFASQPFGEAPYNGFTAYRSRFDRWLADRAVQAGALLVPSCVADDLLWEQGRVAGVRVRREEGELHAPLVIAADGILSLLGAKAGLVRERDPSHYSLGVREVLALPAGTIEDRFQIDPGGGCAALFAGDWPGNLQGGGFIYTNKETLSVGFVAQLASLERERFSILAALDAFKRQPAVARLIRGGERLEYGAHTVPEAGHAMRPRLVRDGMMLVGDAAGLVLTAGVIYEGVHYAMHSGVLAAEVAHRALERGDVSARALAEYPRRLQRGYVGRNLKLFRHMPPLLANSRIYRVYPEAMCRVAEDFFKAEERGHAKLLRLLLRHGGRIGPLRGLKDLWQALRALFV